MSNTIRKFENSVAEKARNERKVKFSKLSEAMRGNQNARKGIAKLGEKIGGAVENVSMQFKGAQTALKVSNTVNDYKQKLKPVAEKIFGKKPEPTGLVEKVKADYRKNKAEFDRKVKVAKFGAAVGAKLAEYSDKGEKAGKLKGLEAVDGAVNFVRKSETVVEAATFKAEEVLSNARDRARIAKNSAQAKAVELKTKATDLMVKTQQSLDARKVKKPMTSERSLMKQ